MTKTDSEALKNAKKAAGERAVDLIQPGMFVGLGTGSTAYFFIEALGKRCQEGLTITAFATSERSAAQAQKLGIFVEKGENLTHLDITVDGADEVDPHKNIIKGQGGALLREKLLAKASREMVVIIDETKLVDHLGKVPVPVEITRFAYRTVLQRLEEKGYQATLRLTENQMPYVTDNGNYIADIQFSTPLVDLPLEEQHLKEITGLLETGLFFKIAGRVIIGYKAGFVEVRA